MGEQHIMWCLWRQPKRSFRLECPAEESRDNDCTLTYILSRCIDADPHYN
jgi:hypothetical protein